MPSDAAQRCVIYARFSPRRDHEQCESIKAQYEFCVEYATKQGWTVDGAEADEAMSGADESRPGIWAAIARLKKGDALLVYKLDRIARDVYLSHVIEQAVRAQGARIVSATGEGTWEDTPEQGLIRNILHALAEYQRKAQAARTRDAMLRHQKNGKRMGGHCPYGWKEDPKDPWRMVEDAGEQEAIEKIREYAQQGLSPTEIANQLERRNYPCRGTCWHANTVRRILERAETP